jgi:DNA polymerase III sliding clamp (beta) subunit (PCNA family)
MEINIKAAVLKNEVAKLYKIFKKEDNFPMSKALSFTGYEDGVLLSARSSTTFAKIFVPCYIKNPHFFSVDGFQVFNYLKTITEESLAITFKPEKEMKVTLATKGSKSKLPILSPETHPVDIDYSTVTFYPMKNFLPMLKKVQFATSKDETRKYLTCIYINNDHAVATSGFLLGLAHFGFSVPFKALFPTEGASAIPEDIASAEDVEMGFSSDDGIEAHLVHLKKGHTVVTIRMMADASKFLHYGPIVSKHTRYQHRFTVNPKHFAEVLKTAKTLTDNNERIQIAISPQSVFFSFENNNTAYQCSVDAGEFFQNPDQHSVTFYLKLDFAIALFQSTSSKTATLLVNSNTEPIFLLDEVDMFLAMPLKP